MQENYPCGYCHSKDTNFSYGVWAHTMNVSDYQALIDRGWRRSGKYCYKPQLDRMCCPTYTIRCKALNFTPTKSHRRVLKCMQNYLTNGEISMTKAITDEDTKEPNTVKKGIDIHNCLPSTQTSSPKKFKQGLGADPNKPRCIKKKLMKAKKFAERLTLQDPCNRPPSTERGKRLEDYIVLNPPSGKHRLQIKWLPVDRGNEEFAASLDTSFQLYRKYQTEIHKDLPSENKFKQYTRFLVDTPLVTQVFRPPGSEVTWEGETGPDIPIPEAYGSYHCQYWLDGEQLIAVGVLDLLPHCLSSKYFYYDPDFNHLSLGVYSALVELAIVRKVARILPDLEYYYMGYYIHSCPKMRYKSRFGPSYLLCTKLLSWVPVEKCLPKLDANSFTQLDETGTPAADSQVNSEDSRVGSVLTFHNYKIMPLMDCLRLKRDPCDKEKVTEEVKTYASNVGYSLCLNSIVLYRS